VRGLLALDVQAAFDGDPAAENRAEVIFALIAIIVKGEVELLRETIRDVIQDGSHMEAHILGGQVLSSVVSREQHGMEQLENLGRDGSGRETAVGIEVLGGYGHGLVRLDDPPGHLFEPSELWVLLGDGPILPDQRFILTYRAGGWASGIGDPLEPPRLLCLSLSLVHCPMDSQDPGLGGARGCGVGPPGRP
jgi:hypothetical protein